MATVRGFHNARQAVVDHVRRIVVAIQAISPDRHGVAVFVVGWPTVSSIHEGEMTVAFGFFVEDRGGSPAIYLAGEMPEDYGMTRQEWWDRELPETVAHEWAHYEQYRDGREVQERGVAVRARSLLRKASASPDDPGPAA